MFFLIKNNRARINNICNFFDKKTKRSFDEFFETSVFYCYNNKTFFEKKG